MKRILMSKYGFVRWPEEDFSDDGNRFTCYRVGDRVRVSKLVSDGWVYIDARIDGHKLPYAVYGNLPHYKALGKLNGVRADSLTEQALLDLCEACLMFEKEYSDAEASVQYPTLSEIRDQCSRILAKRLTELAEVEALLASKVVKLALTVPEWKWKTLREYLVNLKATAEVDIDDRARRMLNNSYSFDFIKPDFSELQDSYYYKWIKDTLSA